MFHLLFFLFMIVFSAFTPHEVFSMELTTQKKKKYEELDEEEMNKIMNNFAQFHGQFVVIQMKGTVKFMCDLGYSFSNFRINKVSAEWGPNKEVLSISLESFPKFYDDVSFTFTKELLKKIRPKEEREIFKIKAFKRTLIIKEIGRLYNQLERCKDKGDTDTYYEGKSIENLEKLHSYLFPYKDISKICFYFTNKEEMKKIIPQKDIRIKLAKLIWGSRNDKEWALRIFENECTKK